LADGVSERFQRVVAGVSVAVRHNDLRGTVVEPALPLSDEG